MARHRNTQSQAVGQALFFGAVHSYQGFLGVIETAVFGLLMGLIFARYRTLWPLAVIHAVTDLVFFVQILNAYT